ncbi:hypothetical protein GYMLUDRAFT_35639 [Collybiopsis luxurians FD-317 M1]|nr:hypothetical protein GYMLUDRAFT_35639 [Collybiopsis luxurians FD-317 M1]
MATADLFETYHFEYQDNDDDLYIESDEEDELSFTPIPDRPLQALRLIRDHLSDEVTYWQGTISSGLVFYYRQLELHIEGGGYSCRLSPRFKIVSKGLHLDYALQLDMQLKRIEKEDLEAQRYQHRSLDSFHFATLVLRMVEAASACQSLSPLPSYAYDLDSVTNTAKDFLHLTPKQICDEILSDYRILHVESILRNDLSQRFKSYRDHLREKLMTRPLGELQKCVPPEHRRVRGDNVEDLADYIVKPKLTFHGTRADLVPSIVQYGFLKPGSTHPGTGFPLPVRCGSTYGRGVYSSPNAAFALQYSGSQCEATKPGGIPGLKLIVCATIMGRTAEMFRSDNWREQTKPYPGSDSHIANNGYEYIVFNNAQVLPCYVVHLNWANAAEADSFVANKLGRPSPTKRPWLDDFDLSCPGDRQRLKEERLAQARKFFAYGYEFVLDHGLTDLDQCQGRES